ncbi:hypothetical protein JB92DRAFT_2836300 [Gautieria morchelliformis]|nr:hypothetical protein JB92DRAFT_2836300 [Gautieria morchelliformis]
MFHDAGPQMGHQPAQGCKLRTGIPPDADCKLRAGVPPDAVTAPDWPPASCGMEATHLCPTRRWCGIELRAASPLGVLNFLPAPAAEERRECCQGSVLGSSRAKPLISYAELYPSEAEPILMVWFGFQPASNCQPEPESCDFIMQPVLLQTLALSSMETLVSKSLPSPYALDCAVVLSWHAVACHWDSDLEKACVKIRTGQAYQGILRIVIATPLRCCHLWTLLTGSEDIDFLNLSVSKLAVGLVSPGAYMSLTHVSFTTLDQFLIKPIGIYGSKSEIVHLLLEIEAVDKDTYGLSSPDAAHRALY